MNNQNICIAFFYQLILLNDIKIAGTIFYCSDYSIEKNCSKGTESRQNYFD